MGESPGTLKQLSIRIDDLERRVQALEHPEEKKLEARSAAVPRVDSAQRESLDTGSIFAVFGRALLGVAGAYLLRALAAGGTAPKLLVAAIGVGYACGWLIWGSRTSRPLARYVYAGTSVLILAPLLWETTLRFGAITPMFSAGVLAGFATLAALLELRDGSARVAWVVQGVAVVTAASLGFVTHHVLPFLLAMLIVSFVMEYARTRCYAEPAWPLVALVTDAALWGLIFVYSGPESAREEYVRLPGPALMVPGLLLLAMNGTAITVRAVAHGLRVSVFDAIQTMIAFGLAIAGLLYFEPMRGEMAAGGLCLVLSAVLYAFSFRWLRGQMEPRNFRVFGTWSAALLIAGVFLISPVQGGSMLLAVAAWLAYWIARRVDSTLLELQGAAFLIAAAVGCAMPQYVFGALAGSVPSRPGLGIYVALLCAVLAFAVERKVAEDSWERNVLQFVPATVAVCAWCALLAHGVLLLSAHALAVEAHHTAFLRTLTISLVSLCLAFAGSRWGWQGMTRLAYVALAFIAAKLLFEDLRHGHMVFIAGSICLFAVTLIAVPRLVRWGARARAAHSQELLAVGKR